MTSKAFTDAPDYFNGILRQHADAQLRATKAVTPKEYRGWSISWDYGYYNAVGPDYDASYEGEEDGWVSNGQTASGRTLDDLRAEIDAWISEHCENCDGEGKVWNNADPTSGQWLPCEACGVRP